MGFRLSSFLLRMSPQALRPADTQNTSSQWIAAAPEVRPKPQKHLHWHHHGAGSTGWQETQGHAQREQGNSISSNRGQRCGHAMLKGEGEEKADMLQPTTSGTHARIQATAIPMNSLNNKIYWFTKV